MNATVFVLPIQCRPTVCYLELVVCFLPISSDICGDPGTTLQASTVGSGAEVRRSRFQRYKYSTLRKNIKMQNWTNHAVQVIFSKSNTVKIFLRIERIFIYFYNKSIYRSINHEKCYFFFDKIHGFVCQGLVAWYNCTALLSSNSSKKLIFSITRLTRNIWKNLNTIHALAMS